MTEQKQIKEMAKVIGDADQRCYEIDDCDDCPFCDIGLVLCKERFVADALYTAGYRKQITGEWVRTDCGGRMCSRCNTPVNYMSNYCPNCGARMKGAKGK